MEMKSFSNRDRFERMLQQLGSYDHSNFKRAIIEVCDTADICRARFEGADIPITAEAVVALTGLVLARERQESDKQEARERYEFEQQGS